MTDFKQQRVNMVETQVRPSDVTDRRIIRAMLELPREDFVPEGVRTLAYRDEAIRVGGDEGTEGGRYLLPPRTLAKLINLAEVGAEAVVLDIGPATGYSSALLAKLAGRVVAVESDRALAAQAEAGLDRLGCGNVRVVRGPLQDGAEEQGPFDVILLNGAVQDVPQPLLEQLKDGGRLVGVLATGSFGRAQVWRRTGERFDARPSFDAGVPPIPGFARATGFVF